MIVINSCQSLLALALALVSKRYRENYYYFSLQLLAHHIIT